MLRLRRDNLQNVDNCKGYLPTPDPDSGLRSGLPQIRTLRNLIQISPGVIFTLILENLCSNYKDFKYCILPITRACPYKGASLYYPQDVP